MDFRLAGKDHIAVLGEAVDLVLSRKDLHRSDEADLRLDGVHQHLAVRYASCEKDSVDLAVSGRGHSRDVLADVQNVCLEESLRQLIAVIGHILDIQHTVRAEISHSSTSSHELLLDLLLGVLSAEAHVDKLERRAAAGSLRSDRAVSAKAVVGVDHLAVPVKGDGRATAHMGDDHCDIIGLVAVLTEVSSHNSP